MTCMQLLFFVVLVMGLGASNGSTQEKDKDKMPYSDLDKIIVKGIFDTTSLGTEIYNKGKAEECFRLYQGTLMAVQPILKEYRQKLASSVRDKMDRAKGMPVVDGAFTLRAALDEIQNEIAPAPKAAASKTLFDRLGGLGGVEKMVNRIFLQAVEDPKVNLFRGKKLDDKAQANLRQSLVEYISSVTGGPLPYKGKDMKAAHTGMKITDDEFNALGAIVLAELKRNAIADADVKEFMTLLESTRKDIVEVKSKN